MEAIIWAFGILIYLVIGILVSMYWYSPKINIIDSELRFRDMQDLGDLKISIFVVLMILSGGLLAFFEKANNFEHWYPKNIYIDFEHPRKSGIKNS